MKPALFLAVAALALVPFAGAASAQEHEHAAGAHADHHADFDSGRFHVRVDGPAEPVGDVILIPGLSSSPEVWDTLTEELKGR